MKSNTRNMILWLATGCCLLFTVSYSFAQCTFSSGSTGTNGDFNPPYSWPTNSGWSVSNDVATGKIIVTVTNMVNGVFNFGKIYIETNYVVNFTRNTLNTPVFILATNDVTIRGVIDVSGGNGAASPANDGGVSGPGGFDGGTGYTPSLGWGTGLGPGGTPGGDTAWGGSFGSQPGQGAGPTYGTIDIQPFIGGSGGGGGDSGGAGGGGGALLIASSTIIDISGQIKANGGVGVYWMAGDGSGGGVRLIANTIQGEGLVQASGAPSGGGYIGGMGRVRIEACNNKRISLTDPPATFGPPGVVFLNPNPTIKVTSIAGVNIPWPPAGSLTKPDTNLPSSFANPADISVSASNINVGTSFKVIVTPAYGANLVATSTLAGTYAYSTGVVTMAVYTDRVWRVNALIDYIPRP